MRQRRRQRHAKCLRYLPSVGASVRLVLGTSAARWRCRNLCASRAEGGSRKGWQVVSRPPHRRPRQVTVARMTSLEARGRHPFLELRGSMGRRVGGAAGAPGGGA
ncbi:hypothetical protein GCM10010176_054170 [Nonomuraea spiralis]|nr:hypothetical protein GCM10010176_054170 [Nonomuraea spiralis]